MKQVVGRWRILYELLVSRIVFDVRPVWYWATFIAAPRFGALGWPFLMMTVCGTKSLFLGTLPALLHFLIEAFCCFHEKTPDLTGAIYFEGVTDFVSKVCQLLPFHLCDIVPVDQDDVDPWVVDGNILNDATFNHDHNAFGHLSSPSDLDRPFLAQRASLGTMASKEFPGLRLRVQTDFMARTFWIEVPRSTWLDDPETEHLDIIHKARIDLKSFLRAKTPFRSNSVGVFSS